MTAAADLARQLEAKKMGPGAWMARCPAHDDRTASLSIAEGEDGRLLLKCHAGCDFAEILKAAGVEPAKPNGEDRGGKPRIVATYDYHDATGELVFQVVRMAPEDFRQRRPDRKGGWVWNLNGVERVPYRVPELLDTTEVFVVESDAAGSGPPASRSGSRVGTSRSFPTMTSLAESTLQRLRTSWPRPPRASRWSSCRLPKGDVSDWLDQGHTTEDLRSEIDGAPYWEPGQDDQEQEQPGPLDGVLDLATWQGRPIPERKWTVSSWMPQKQTSSLYGDGATRKSTLVQQLGTCLAVRRDWLGLPTICGRALLVFCEDDEDELHRRQDAINQHYGIDYSDLGGNLRFVERVGRGNLLIAFASGDVGHLTPFFAQLEAECKRFDPT